MLDIQMQWGKKATEGMIRKISPIRGHLSRKLEKVRE